MNGLENRPGAARMRRAAAIITAAMFLSVPGLAQACEQYGPAPAALTGMVSSLQASGPPGYGQTPKTDPIVQVPVLQLSPPICVDADPANPANTAERDINTVQLVFPPSGPQFRPGVTGTSFVVSGTLVHASGPEHRTPVVLVVGDMQQVLQPTQRGPLP